MAIIRSHNIDYIRSGSCRRCGECEKLQCPHFHFESGLATCDVHDKRDEVCESCSITKGGMWYKKGKPITHAVCFGFPDHPGLRVITEGICGYKFQPATEEDARKHEVLRCR